MIYPFQFYFSKRALPIKAVQDWGAQTARSSAIDRVNNGPMIGGRDSY